MTFFLRRCFYRIIWVLFRIVFKYCFHYSVKGKENIPSSGPFLLVSNHESFLDPIAVALIQWRLTVFMAMDGVLRAPISGWAVSCLPIIRVHPGKPDRSALETALRMLGEGHAVAIFPEGTRNDGDTSYPFKAGVGFIVSRSACPILPVGVRGSHRALGKGDVFPKPRPVDVVVGERIDPEELLERFSHPGRARKIAASLREVVQNLAYPPGEGDVRV